MLARDVCQHVAHKLQLPLPHQSAIGAVSWCPGVIAEVINVIEQDKGRAGVLKGIVARSEYPLPGLTRASVVPGFEIDVVIAGAMVPRDTRRTQQLQISWVERQVIEHHVAMVDAEGCACSKCTGDDVIAQVAELDPVLWLCVGEKQDLEAGALPLPNEGKVNGGRQRTGFCHASVAPGDVFLASARLIKIRELRD